MKSPGKEPEHDYEAEQNYRPITFSLDVNMALITSILLSCAKWVSRLGDGNMLKIRAAMPCRYTFTVHSCVCLCLLDKIIP